MQMSAFFDEKKIGFFKIYGVSARTRRFSDKGVKFSPKQHATTVGRIASL